MMTNREKAIVMAYTGIAMLTGDKLDIFYKYIEEKLGYLPYTHELADESVDKKIKEAAKADFIALCGKEESTVVYVITKGDYSDYHICEVTTDKERAEQLCKLYTDSYDEARVEEFDTSLVHENLDKLIPVYHIQFNQNGAYHADILQWIVNTKDFNPTFELNALVGPKSLEFSAKLTAKDMEHAIKIASDRRAKMLAEKFGI